MSDYAIEIKELEKDFDKFHLGPIDLKVPTGCMVGYIGENGAGKSTTIKLILGLLHKDRGEINVLGQPMDIESNAIMNRIGIVFDELHLPAEMKVEEADKFAHMAFDHWESETFQKYINKFNLPLTMKIEDLSRGMKMKLSLAIALSHGAELLILDEATSGLDPAARDEVLDILMDYLQDESHTILISSHILSDLEKVADYIAFIHKGHIIFMEEKDRLQERYGICSVDKETAEAIDPKAILGSRRHAFGEELLVDRRLVPKDLDLVKPSIEDIMVFIIKGDKDESNTL